MVAALGCLAHNPHYVPPGRKRRTMGASIRVGIVGAASRGRSFIAAFRHHPHAEITALCDIRRDALDEQAQTLGIEHVFTEYEAMLDSGLVNAVLIGTPMPLHVPQAIPALERGFHVLSEVPAGVSIDECQALVRAARKSAGVYMMAENYCYIRSNVIVREMVRQGLFGDIYLGEGEYVHELKGLNVVTPWRRRWQTGINGNTYCTHSLGPLLQWFAGQRVVSVSCVGTGHHYTDPEGHAYEQEDSVLMLGRLSGGGLVECRLDMLSERPHRMAYYSLQGTTGVYESAYSPDDRDRIWTSRFSPDRVEWKPLEDYAADFLPPLWRNPPKEALESGHWGGDYFEVQDFLQAALDGGPAPIDIDAAMDMTLPGLVSQQSIAQGSAWLPVPDSRTWG